MRFRHRVGAYHRLGLLGAQETLVYRANYLLNIAGVAVQVYLMTALWTAVYAGRTVVDDVPLPMMVAYVTMVSVQTWLTTTSSHSLLPERVRQGSVAVDLCRPVGMMQQLVATRVGRVLVLLPFGVAALPVAVLAGGIQAPASGAAALTYAASLLLAIALAVLLGDIVGMVSFWTVDVRGVTFVYDNVNRFLAGALVPLWFMPDWLRISCEFLPFQAMSYTPVAVYLGWFTGAEVLRALGVQSVWVLAAYLLGRLVWRRGLDRVVVQGG
jgi:ABC-type uncharacterized transport system permease subunit